MANFPVSVYKAALDSSNAGQYFLTPSVDPIFLEVNDTFLKIAMLNREDVIGKKLFDVFPANPADTKDTGLEALRHSLQTVITTGIQHHLPLQRYPIKTKKLDGSISYEERYWCASNTPIFNDEGSLLCISHQTNEVTEKVYAEQALKKSEARYRSLTDSIDEGFCIVEVLFDGLDQPTDYIFHEVNPVFEDQTGLIDATGKSMRQMVPDHDAHWFDTYGRVAKTGQPIRFESGSKSLGRIFDVYAYPVDQPGENMVGIVFRDITQRKNDEDQLRHSESRLSALISATAEVVYRMSPDWSEIHQLQGRGSLRDVQYSKPFRMEEYIPEEHHKRLQDAIQKAILEKSKFEVELKVILADGSIGWMESRAIPMIDETTGEINEWVGTSSDITDRKRAEDELRDVARRKDDFLAMLAHELRNPLAPISSAAHILSLAKNDPQRVGNCSDIISRQVSHMTKLIEDLLDVSRVTRGLIPLDTQQVDLKEIINQSIEQVKPLLDKHQHRFTHSYTAQSVFVMGDQDRLIQVITNILNNAIKYTPDKGTIDLTLEIENTNAKISISDNGIGMEPELIENVFELFVQASRSSDRSQGGLGIGLALAKSLVDLHDGQITAYSPGLEQGSRFEILLPLFKDGYIDQIINSDLIQNFDTLVKTSKVLVVDDNVDAADLIATLLEMSGYQVIIEYDAQKSFERAKIEKPSVIILDIGLPDMNGKELATLLRSQPEIEGATLIALTGYSEEQEMANAKAAGFDHYFVKPVDIERLLRVLRDQEAN